MGGYATNLIPVEEPQDIYQKVADLVNRRMEWDAEHAKNEEDREAARQLRGKIDRNDVKHATMTTPHGVTWRTIYKQLLEKKLIKSCKNSKKCAKYLAKILEETILEVAVEAGNLMTWLRSLARTLATVNRGMVWTTSTGFPVIHAIREKKTKRLSGADQTLLIYVRMKHGTLTQESKPTASSLISFTLWMPPT